MSSLRDSIASIPSALTNLISESASTASSYLYNNTTDNATDTSSSSYNFNGDKSLPIPASLVKEQWRLIFTSDANKQDLESSIAHCRDLVLLSDECSEERLWLVRHLVDLRYALSEMQAAEANLSEKGPELKSVVGHHFVAYERHNRQVHPERHHCDHCSGLIFKIIQFFYICKDCGYLVHQKCIDSVLRVCPYVTAMERQYPIAEICPQLGLAAQRYTCAECEIPLIFNMRETVVSCFGRKSKDEDSWIEPRLCDYSGQFFCPSCHWNDSSIIPARIICNWDFTPRKVGRASLQEINLFLEKPLIKLEEVNPKLFVFLEKLATIKKMRQNLIYMRKYLMECRNAIDEKLLEKQIGKRRYLIQSNEFYALSDLLQVESGALTDFLQKIFGTFEQHIRNCKMCTAKAYICEICSNDEVKFPFDDGCVNCHLCNSIYHRVCMSRKNMVCPKCVRLEKRKQQLERAISTNSEEIENEH